MLEKMDVTYQSVFIVSENPSPPAAEYTSPLKKMLHALTGSKKPSTPSPVARGADYVSPYNKKYWDMMTKHLRQLMKGMKEDYILKAIKKLRNENPEYHDGIIDDFIKEYDEHSQSCEGDADSIDSEGLKGLSK